MAGPSSRSSPLARIPLVLAICVGLGATGTLLGLSTVLSWGEPLPPPPELILPPAQPGLEEIWARAQHVFAAVPAVAQSLLAAHRPRLTALAVVNLLSSAALLLGAFLARQRAPAGHAILATGLVLSQAYAVLKLGVKTWFEVDMLGRLGPLVGPLLDEGGDAASIGATFLGFQALTVGLVAAVALLELGFYVYAARYFHRPEVAALLVHDPELDDG